MRSDKSLRSYKNIEERRRHLEEKLNRKFKAIAIYPDGLKEAQYKNCENMIGAVQIPLGIAGPITISGQWAKGDYFLPLATTEGALVASVNRGCKAVRLSGGVKVYTQNPGITRGSVFQTKGLEESLKLKNWLDDNFTLLQSEALSASSHLKLTKIHTNITGRKMFIRFSFDTADAMGMNMATIAADKLAKLIEKKTNVSCISLAGNFDIDKKPAWLNFILGRGRQIWAEATIKGKIVSEVLKTKPSQIHRVAIDKCLYGSALSGSLGFNAHFANIVAAIFIACGQDPGHIVEGSLGITSTEIVNRDLYISVYLPCMAAGTVGGGTYLPSQNEALEIIGVSGGKEGKNAAAFAEVLAAAVLAGELSLLSSLAQGSLASSHLRLARNHK